MGWGKKERIKQNRREKRIKDEEKGNILDLTWLEKVFLSLEIMCIIRYFRYHEIWTIIE